MKRIKIFDTTLRDGEQSPGCSMNLNEKIEMARQLEKLGVDVIEAGFAIASPMDFKSVQTIASVVENATVASLARCTKGDIDAAWDAVKEARHPRIHVFLATSDIHMEYKLRMTREQVLATITEMVGYAHSKCADIEFSAEDASRSDHAFLAQCYSNAIAAGATTLNVPDTVGYSTPQEMAELIGFLRENVVGAENVDFSVHCHDDLGMAVANSLACVKAGATQVECTVNGIGERAGNASLEEIVMALKTRSDFYQAETGINTKQIYQSSKRLSNITGVPIPPSKAIVGANAFAHESGIHQHGVIANAQTYEIMKSTDVGIPKNTMVLGKHSGKHALREKLESMGYELTDEELSDVFKNFKELADKKKTITGSDIEALVLNRRNTAAAACELVSHVVNAGDGLPNTSCVKIKRDDKVLQEVAIGSGPLDASFKAINRMLHMDVKLDSFSLNAVTDGEDAIGEAVVKISDESGKTFTGTGLSTDIIESSIRAYVNGINKMAGEWYHILYNNVYGIRACSLRLTNTIGPRMRIKDARQTFLGVWIRQVLTGKPFEVWGGEQLRDFTYVDDCVDAMMRAALHEEAFGQIFNIGGGKRISLRDLADLLVDTAGEGAYEVREYPADRKKIDIGDYYADDSRLRSLLGWEPRTQLRDGLRQIIDYYRPRLQDYL